MIELSMGSFIAAVIAGLLGFGGAIGSASGAARFLSFVFLGASLASVVWGAAHRWASRRSLPA